MSRITQAGLQLKFNERMATFPHPHKINNENQTESRSQAVLLIFGDEFL